MKKIFRLQIVFLAIALSLVMAACSTTTPALTSDTVTPTTATTTATLAPTTTSVTTTTTTPKTTATTTHITPAVTLNVSAAASLTDALKEINTLYVQANPNVTVTPNFASSGTLQTQIENGAPADVFISAASTQMDNLQKEGLILEVTRKNLLNNKIVMVVPNDSTLGLTGFSDLATDKVKKMAIGDPKSVPSGTYALQTFDELGITAKVQPKEVLGADVRGVLTYVESGNVDAGIVYSTDALTSKLVKVVASAPADINAKVVYPVAIIKATHNPAPAQKYFNFLFSTPAKAVFEKYGFTMAGN